MTVPRCEDCLFYVEDSRLIELEKLGPGAPTGHCRRYPPQVLVDRPDCFPEVAREDFCGEFISLSTLKKQEQTPPSNEQEEPPLYISDPD